MQKLSILANGTDKEGSHSYCSLVYDRLFFPYAHKSVSILEIGVLHGGSLIMWDKFFKNAEKIVGLDSVNRHFLLDEYKSEKIKVIIDNAYTAEVAARLGEFDIIIDDGSHHPIEQALVVDLYLPKLRSGGIMVIEDVSSSSLDYVKNHIDSLSLSPEYNVKVLDLRDKTASKLDDDILILIKRR